MTSSQRSYNMSRIRGKDTKPEMIVRKYLWAHGFRYRLNYKWLPGKPDIVLRKYRTCVFVNGCFWHGHYIDVPFTKYQVPFEETDVDGPFTKYHVPFEETDVDGPCTKYHVPFEGDVDGLENSECCKIPHTNREFWVKKIMRNKSRDIEVQHRLAGMGWHCVTIWECELKTAKREQTLQSLAYTLNHIYMQDVSVHKPKTYSIPDDEFVSKAAEDFDCDFIWESKP